MNISQTTVPLLAVVLFAACESAVVDSAAPAAASLARSSPDPEFQYETIAVEGASFTTVQGINSDGSMVGWYVKGGVTRGFLLSDGNFTTIDFQDPDNPDNPVVYTDARGIGPNGEIVGTYRLSGEPAGLAFHGYRRTPEGAVVPVRYEGHRYEILQRILPDGTILGCRHDNDLMDSMRGISVGRVASTETALHASMHNGATPSGGRIVGLYTNMDAGNRQEGYLLENDVVTPLLFPGSQQTAAWDVNPRGDIVGNYRDATGRNRAFLRHAGRYLSVDFPGATVTITRAWGINAAGDIVGHYVAGGVARGYVARRVAS